MASNKNRKTPPITIDEAGNIDKKKRSLAYAGRKKGDFDWDGDDTSNNWPPDAMIADVIGNRRNGSDDGCGFMVGADDIF